MFIAIAQKVVAATTEVYYVHNDHLGTPQAITDKNQAIVWQARYDPFGKATVTTGLLENNVRFPGQYFDGETGLHYNYYRYYDPSTGRYITSDPIGLRSGLNTYAYVNANPLSYIDPLGLARSRKGLPKPEYRKCDDAADKVCNKKCGCGNVGRCVVVLTPKFIVQIMFQVFQGVSQLDFG